MRVLSKACLLLLCITILPLSFSNSVKEDKKIVYVKADWCGACKMQIPELMKFVRINKTKIVVYDLDRDRDLIGEKFYSPSIPTFFFVRNGIIVKKVVGLIRHPALKCLSEKHLNDKTELECGR